MIDKTSSGTAISADYIAQIAQDNREFLAKLLINGVEVSCSIVRLTITKGSCSAQEQFTIGDVISSTLIAELKDLNENVKGEEIEVQIGLLVGEDYEFVTVGFFTASIIKKTVYTTVITGYGRTVSKTGDAFSSPTVQTLSAIASEIAHECGCSVELDSSIDGTLEIEKPIVGLTTYQVLQLLSESVGGYAVDTYDGNIKIHLFDDTPTVSVTAGRMVHLPDAEEVDFEVTGVQIIATPEGIDSYGGTIPEVSYSSGSPIVLVDSNAYITEDLFDGLDYIVGYTYRPATISLSLGDPRIEGNDVLSVTDVNGNVYVVPCHLVTHVYDGGFASTIVSTNPTPQADEIGTTGFLSSQLANINSEIVSVANSAEESSIRFTLTTDYSDSQTVVLSAHIIKGGKDITNQYPETMFYWYSKSEDGVTPIGYAYSITYNREDAGFGTTIVCSCILNDNVLLFTPDNYAVITPDGYGLLTYINT